MTEIENYKFSADVTVDESMSDFESNEKFLAAIPTDESHESDVEMEEEDSDMLISSFRRGTDTTDRTRDDAYGYLQEIAKTPLLTPEEEIELFQRFEVARQSVEELLNQLPPSILASVRQQAESGYRTYRDTKPGMWWSPMNISSILGQIQKEMKVYDWQWSDGDHISAASPKSANGSCQSGVTSPIEHQCLATVWNALQKAAGEMQEAKMKIVEANLLLVASVTKQHYFPQLSLSFLDLMQEGSIGLMKAVEKFDLTKGHRFSTYATWWIMQAITRARHQQNQTIRTPCYVGDKRRAIKQAMTKLTGDLERQPNLTEVAEAVDMPKDRVIEILQGTQKLVSLSSPVSSSLDTTMGELLPDESQITPEEEYISRSKTELVEKVLSTLTAREAKVIKLRFGLIDGEEHTLAEIGDKLGVSRERIRQIEVEALRKLRHPTRTKDLRELV